MKQNKIIILISIIFMIFILIWWYKIIINKNNKIKVVNTTIPLPDKIKKVDNKKETNIDEHNIQKFKNLVASKWLIISWDIHLKNDEYIYALQKFLNANKKTPHNSKILSKIAETYFMMKNYDQAYKYYSKIKDSNNIDKNKKTLSFLYSQKLENFNFTKNSSWTLNNNWNVFISKLKKEIKSFNLEKDQEFYYKNSVECLNNFHNCKLNYENYFKNTQYSWKNENLENIRTAINNYKNLKIEELYYKNALIIWALMQNKNFSIAIKLSKKLLKEKKNYKPILKIIAQSYFELNLLKKASYYLLEYAKIDSKSSDVSYMIWVISQKEKDYLKSNIFLNLSLEQWYPNIESIYRLQLYNYLILSQESKIADIFDKIIEIQEKPNFNDLLLSTYYNIINNNLNKALTLSNKWLELYPEKEDFYWFKAWILIEKLDFNQAEELLDKAFKINPRNALILLNKWRIYQKKFNDNNKVFYKAKAKLFFNKSYEFDSAEVGQLAKKYLKELDKEKSVD